MHDITIRFDEDLFLFFALMDGSDFYAEGIGETIPDALRDLAENIETGQR